MLSALRCHWREYLMESAALAAFMISACTFGVLLGYPGEPLNRLISQAFLRQAAGGLAMGLTAVAIICSPWGQRSGAHMNPAVTLTFWSLGKIQRWDAFFYVAAQFAGGLTGVAVAAALLGHPLAHSTVNYVVTMPGRWGVAAAFAAEVLISFLMMLTVLVASNSPRFSRYTPVLAGTVVMLFITFEAPYSGMSMNPARTFGSAFSARQWASLWIYFSAPLLGMGAAAQVFRWRRGAQRVFCAKFHHHNNQPCIFRCNYGALISSAAEQ